MSGLQRSGRAKPAERAALEEGMDAWAAGRVVTCPDPEDFALTRRLQRRHVQLRTPDALHLAIASNRGFELATLDDTLAKAAARPGMTLAPL